MAAPRPRPAALKLLNGRGPGVDSGGRKVKPTPGFTRLPPEPPFFLEGEALAEWNRVVPELQRLRLVKPVDSAALTAYCLAWQRLVDANAVIAREGLTKAGPHGEVRHPAVVVVEAASKELRSWAVEFGLTPSSEQRVGGRESDDGHDDNPFS